MTLLEDEETGVPDADPSRTDTSRIVRPYCDKHEVGRRIRAARWARGWSLAAMSAEADRRGYRLESNTIAFYERAMRNVTVERLHQIAIVLGVTTQELLIGRQDDLTSIRGPITPLLSDG